MRLDLGPSIETVRAEALERIDKRAATATEAIRPTHLAAMDAQRLAEAREALQNARQYRTSGACPALAAIPGEIPFLAKAQAVIDAAKEAGHRRLTLEAARLAAKAAIRGAATVAAIRAITLEEQSHV